MNSKIEDYGRPQNLNSESGNGDINAFVLFLRIPNVAGFHCNARIWNSVIVAAVYIILKHSRNFITEGLKWRGAEYCFEVTL